MEQLYPCIDKYQINNAGDWSLQTADLQASFQKRSLWNIGSTIKVGFFDGSNKQKQWVQNIIQSKLAPHVNLTFQWFMNKSDASKCDIRISFVDSKSAWSYIGTTVRSVPRDQPTMNLGWLDDDTQFNNNPTLKNTGQVVLHEFGHAIGMIHEHQQPNAKIDWDRDAVLEDLARRNGWDADTVQVNIFDKYNASEYNSSEYDPKSIMHYWFSPKWVRCGATNPSTLNTQLSPTDIEWIRKTYPRLLSTTDPKKMQQMAGAVPPMNISAVHTFSVQEHSFWLIPLVVMSLVAVAIIVSLWLAKRHGHKRVR